MLCDPGDWKVARTGRLESLPDTPSADAGPLD
jgi:hypothetical protein